MIELTYEEILNKALDMVPENLDKREGSIIYTAMAPICDAITQFYIYINDLYKLGFPDTAHAQYLDKCVAPFGISRYPAIHTVKQGIFSFDSAPTDILDRVFIIDDLKFIATQKISDTEYRLTSEKPTQLADSVSGTLVPETRVDGLISAQIGKTLVHFYDTEDDESLRARFFAHIRKPSFSGNISDYKNMALSFENVSFAKIFCGDDMGSGNVGIVIASNNKGVLDSGDIQKISNSFNNSIDGIAPIGHTVKINSIKPFPLNIKFYISTEDNVNINSSIEKKISQFIESIPFDSNIVSISKIIGSILDNDRVLDVQNLQINDSYSNIYLTKTFNNFQIANIASISIGKI